MNFTKFEVEGKPQRWQRRVVTRSGHSFMPDEVKSYKALIRDAYRRATHGLQQKPHDGPVVLQVTAYFPIPKSRPQWFKALCAKIPQPMVSTPDLDNIVKIVKDALNGYAYKDDRQVYSYGDPHKLYDERPRLEVMIFFEEPMTREKAKELLASAPDNT